MCEVLLWVRVRARLEALDRVEGTITRVLILCEELLCARVRVETIAH